jgi:aspartate carbamoyltransferase
MWKNRNIISITDITRLEFFELFNVALKMKKIVEEQGKCDKAYGKVLGNIFYEPSTRTSCSFQVAMMRLGGDIVNIQGSTSSITKGESLNDTIMTVASYTDIVVLRHPIAGVHSNFIKQYPDKIPIINAGDGSNEHPTQTMLDLFTIYSKFKVLDNICITFVGDLKYGRTVHSLCLALLQFYNISINFVSSEILKIPKKILKKINNKIKIKEYNELSDEILEMTDVLYVTRIQKERFTDLEFFEKFKDSFRITNDTMKSCSDNMILMHPLPRIREIAVEVDKDPRAVYFEQMKNGMYIRMALLSMILDIM